MASLVERTAANDRVADIIRLLRRRWRLRHALVGLVLVAGTTFIALWVAAAAMQRAGFSETSITAARIVVGLIVAAIGLRWIAWPLMRRVPDQRVALYAEERLPALDGALVSAVDATSPAAPEEIRTSSLLQGLVQDAVRRLRPHGDGAAVEQGSIRRAGIVLAMVLAVGTAIFVLGPAYLRHGLALIATPWRSAAEVAPYSIGVTPGNANVPKGADQQISAQLRGFNSDLVELIARRGANAEWERIPMGAAGDSIRFTARLFDVATDVEYYIESNGVRSSVFRLTVRNLPAVRRIDLDLRYPGYTGLAPEHIEDGGDVAAVAGTRVRVSIRSTLPVRGGRLMLEGDSAVLLQRANDSTLVGELVVRRDGFYRIELEAPDGTNVAGSVDYVIDALDDQPPTVRISKPGRDIRPTNVDEIFVETEASDDFGVGKVELVYSVNGTPEKAIVLNDSAARTRDFVAGHTFFLEEMGLQAGDVVSYFARAKDAAGGKEASSDIYFMTVRPFGRDYRQNQQGGGGGGGGGQNPGALTQQQRDIVAATFKVDRNKATASPTDFRENVTTIQLSEGKLRGQVEQLAERMNRPIVQATDTGFRVIAEYLRKAAEEMKTAEEQLGKKDTKEALPPEQRALQNLERAEAVYRDVQVSMGNQGGGGGGGGGQQASAEDLADLFELETDKLRNQYEQVQRGQQQNANAEMDETLERLKQLAARQQQENERARQRAQNLSQSGGSGGGGSQRQLADEAEQMARQLERLAREQNSSEMAESARRLQEAANQMRRSASSSGSAGSAASASALDRMEEARRLLEQGRNANQTQGVEDAARRAGELARQQRDVAQGVGELPNAGASRSEKESRLDARKEQMTGDVQRLQDDIDRMSRDLRRDRPETARQLQDAAARMREGRLRDMIQYSRGLMRQGAPDYARSFEGQIQESLDTLSSRLNRAANGATGEGQGQRNATESLDRARDLVRGLNSLDDRMRAQESQSNGGRQQGTQGQSPNDRRQQGQQGQGQQGQEKQGQQGQGQQGQQGQGQQGQQGQGQQGQGQQGQGQQGQGQQGQGQGQGQAQQGQGQGGQPGDRGLAGGQPNGMNVRPQGSPSSPGGGGPGAAWGGYSGEDIRQLNREWRNQREAAEALRRELQREGRETSDLNRLIDQLRQMESARVFNDPEELAKLRTSVVEGFKEFEFTLRRQLAGAEKDRPVLGGNEDVPQGYRELVNEYFKSLSKRTPPPPKP